jgi:Protein of unknown function (DUF4089)
VSHDRDVAVRKEHAMSTTPHDVESLAALVGLTIDPDDHAAVARQYAAMLAAAQLLLDFPLPETVEAAPVFEP